VISDIARKLRDRIAPGRYTLYRFLSSRRSPLPDDYRALTEILGPLAFSPKSRSGILLMTPLRITTDITRQPYRSAFFLSADSPEELFGMDEMLLRKLCR